MKNMIRDDENFDLSNESSELRSSIFDSMISISISESKSSSDSNELIQSDKSNNLNLNLNIDVSSIFVIL